MPVNVEGVRIEGLKEVQRALKKYGDEAPKELREELKNSSATLKVVSDARRRLTEGIGKNLKRDSRSTGRAAASLRVLSNANGVFIVGGKGSVPYYGWLDFGGQLHPTGSRYNGQKRNFIKQGRAIYPAINENIHNLERAAEDAVARAKRKAGL